MPGLPAAAPLTQFHLLDQPPGGRYAIACYGLPLHGFRTLPQDLGTLAYNVTHTQLNPKAKIFLTTRPTPLQAKAFALLGVNPACTE